MKHVSWALGCLLACNAAAQVLDGSQSVLVTYARVGTAGVGLDRTNGLQSAVSFQQGLVRASATIDLPRRSLGGLAEAFGAGPPGLASSTYAVDAFARYYEFVDFAGSSGAFNYNLLFDGFMSAAGGAPFGSVAAGKASLSVYDVTGLALPLGGTTLPLLNVNPSATLVHCKNVVTSAYAILPMTIAPALGPCQAVVEQKQFANAVDLVTAGSFVAQEGHRYAFVYDLNLYAYVSGNGAAALADFSSTLSVQVTGLAPGLSVAHSTGSMVSAVPEPGTLALLGGGLWGLGAYRRGRGRAGPRRV